MKRAKSTAPEQKLANLRMCIREALAEIDLARAHMTAEWMGPQHEALEWATSILERGLEGRRVAQ